MEMICDFSIGIDNGIEKNVFLYDNRFTEDEIMEFLENVIHDKLITIGEWCEGTISDSSDTIIIQSRWCSNYQKSWSDSVWTNEEISIPRKVYNI
jgi:hypothetical protein